MRSIIFILTSLFFHAILVARSADSIFIGKSGKLPVVYSASPVVVDGELDEPIWSGAFV